VDRLQNGSQACLHLGYFPSLPHFSLLYRAKANTKPR
jgi:hypothetical protein